MMRRQDAGEGFNAKPPFYAGVLGHPISAACRSSATVSDRAWHGAFGRSITTTLLKMQWWSGNVYRGTTRYHLQRFPR
jgi:hypothetical protein